MTPWKLLKFIAANPVECARFAWESLGCLADECDRPPSLTASSPPPTPTLTPPPAPPSLVCVRCRAPFTFGDAFRVDHLRGAVWHPDCTAARVRWN